MVISIELVVILGLQTFIKHFCIWLLNFFFEISKSKVPIKISKYEVTEVFFLTIYTSKVTITSVQIPFFGSHDYFRLCTVLFAVSNSISTDD